MQPVSTGIALEVVMAKFFSTLDALAEKLLDTFAARLYTFNGTTWDRVYSSGGSLKSLLASIGNGGMSSDATYGHIIRPFTFAGYATDFMPVCISVFNGATWDRLRTPAIFKSQDAVGIATEAAIWTPAAGKKFRVMGYALVSSVAGNVLLRDNTAGAIIAVIPSDAGGNAESVNLGNGILSAAANNVLTAAGPASSTLSGMVWGTEE